MAEPRTSDKVGCNLHGTAHVAASNDHLEFLVETEEGKHAAHRAYALSCG
jgi:hypothetical protein